MTTIEHRRAPRIQTRMPVEFESGSGVTRDISVSGVFFEANKSFSPGEPIEFTIFLEHIDPAGPVRMKCLGRIVRVEEKGKKIGVAATIDSHIFSDKLELSTKDLLR